jgi:hypothetical protein
MSEKKIDDLEAVRLISDTLSAFEPADRERIVRWVLEKTGVRTPSPSSPRQTTVASFAASDLPTRPAGGTDIKSFVLQKDPKSDNQFAATVAYFYKFEAPPLERKDAIGQQDLLDGCRLAARKRMGDPSKTLANAQSVGLLNKVDRGQYAISAVGENLVALTLPESVAGRSFDGKRLNTKKRGRSGGGKKSK